MIEFTTHRNPLRETGNTNRVPEPHNYLMRSCFTLDCRRERYQTFVRLVSLYPFQQCRQTNFLEDQDPQEDLTNRQGSDSGLETNLTAR